MHACCTCTNRQCSGAAVAGGLDPGGEQLHFDRSAVVVEFIDVLQIDDVGGEVRAWLVWLVCLEVSEVHGVILWPDRAAPAIGSHRCRL